MLSPFSIACVKCERPLVFFLCGRTGGDELREVGVVVDVLEPEVVLSFRLLDLLLR